MYLELSAQNFEYSDEKAHSRLWMIVFMIAEFAFSDNPISVVHTDYVVVGGSFFEEHLCVFTLRYGFDFIGCGAGVFSDCVEYGTVVGHHLQTLG